MNEDKSKTKRRRRATIRRDRIPRIDKPCYYMHSKRIFGDIVLGKQDHFVTGEKNTFWRKFKGDPVGQELYVVSTHTPKVRLKAKIKNIFKTQDRKYYVDGVRGDIMVIELENIRPTPFTVYFVNRYLGDEWYVRREKKHRRELQSKIKNAFRNWDLGGDEDEKEERD